MRRMNVLIVITFLFSATTNAQSCNCTSEYKWVKKTFVENDAGYSYYVEKYGKQAIAFNDKKWEKEFAKTSNVWQCNDYLNAWIKFYRKGHIAVAMADQTKARPAVPNKAGSTSTGNVIPELNINIDSFQVAVKAFENAGYEGVWTNGTYNVGIKKVKGQYVGFVISSTNDQWKARQIKFSFPLENSTSKESIYYMGNHSLAQNQFEHCQLIGKTYLKAFDIYWKRISPDFAREPKIDEAVSLISTPGFYMKQIDSITTVFRIPSFDNAYIATIDSIVHSNHHLLTNSKNLIIDIRGNGGGADRAYDSITPYLYTNPIRTMWVSFLSTPLNNARYDWISKLDGFSDKERQGFRDMQTKLNAHIGRFVNLNESNQTVVMDTLPVGYQNPQQVAILIDGANASTAEQFILMAKQSKKVKIYGQPTAGALDFSNLNNVVSPSGNYKLFYATSKSYRLPKMAIDDYGIQPDYYIDESIPSYKWIEFVSEAMKVK